MKRPNGFSLIEILAAMSILAIGMVSVFSLVFGSMKIGITATDRNAAAVIIPQAIEDIQRTYLVTGNMKFAGFSPNPLPTTDQIDTLLLTNMPANATDPSIASIQQPQFQSLFKGAAVTAPPSPIPATPPPPQLSDSAAVWPIGLTPVYYGGPGGIATGTVNDQTSFAYRVIFKLERHPLWQNDADINAGVYVLTLIVYRDLNRKATNLQQVSDPVVVYLKDKKVRS